MTIIEASLKSSSASKQPAPSPSTAPLAPVITITTPAPTAITAVQNPSLKQLTAVRNSSLIDLHLLRIKSFVSIALGHVSSGIPSPSSSSANNSNNNKAKKMKILNEIERKSLIRAIAARNRMHLEIMKLKSPGKVMCFSSSKTAAINNDLDISALRSISRASSKIMPYMSFRILHHALSLPKYIDSISTKEEMFMIFKSAIDASRKRVDVEQGYHIYSLVKGHLNHPKQITEPVLLTIGEKPEKTVHSSSFFDKAWQNFQNEIDEVIKSSFVKPSVYHSLLKYYQSTSNMNKLVKTHLMNSGYILLSLSRLTDKPNQDIVNSVLELLVSLKVQLPPMEEIIHDLQMEPSESLQKTLARNEKYKVQSYMDKLDIIQKFRKNNWVIPMFLFHNCLTSLANDKESEKDIEQMKSFFKQFQDSLLNTQYDKNQKMIGSGNKIFDQFMDLGYSHLGFHFIEQLSDFPAQFINSTKSKKSAFPSNCSFSSSSLELLLKSCALSKNDPVKFRQSLQNTLSIAKSHSTQSSIKKSFHILHLRLLAIEMHQSSTQQNQQGSSVRSQKEILEEASVVLETILTDKNNNKNKTSSPSNKGNQIDPYLVYNAYSAYLELLIQSGKSNEAWDTVIAKVTQSHGLEPNSHLYNTYARAVGLSLKDKKGAIAVIASMQADDVIPDQETLDVIADIYFGCDSQSSDVISSAIYSNQVKMDKKSVSDAVGTIVSLCENYLIPPSSNLLSRISSNATEVGIPLQTLTNWLSVLENQSN